MKIEGMDAIVSKVSLEQESRQTIVHDESKVTTSKQTDTSTKVKEQEAPSEEEVKEAVERINKAIFGSGRNLEFSIHEATHEIMVKVIDSSTKEVIREIPPEKVLDRLAKLWELAGIIVDEKR